MKKRCNMTVRGGEGDPISKCRGRYQIPRELFPKIFGKGYLTMCNVPREIFSYRPTFLELPIARLYLLHTKSVATWPSLGSLGKARGLERRRKGLV